jgi:TatD DNase family protein
MRALIDTHCHLDPAYYPSGADDALARARAAGVGAFVAIGVGDTLGPARHAIAVAERRPDVWASVGLHPHDAKVGTDELLAELEQLARHDRVVAVGEIGLDYHYDSSPRGAQVQIFREGIRLARRVKKPIVVHTRDAADDTLRILDEEGAREVGGIIHCFSEDRAFAERALAMDLDVSFSGIVTFKNARAVQEVAAWAPLDRILVETDSPYLAPIPFRGKTNEPAFVVHTARKVAELRGASLEAIAEATTANACRRLGVQPAS